LTAILSLIYKLSCQILTKLEFSCQIFEAYSNTKNENPSSGSRVVPYGRVGGQTWQGSSCFSQHCEHGSQTDSTPENTDN